MRIAEVEPLEGYCIRATFCDGAIKDIDLRNVFGRGGVFASIRDRLRALRAGPGHPETHTVEWPGEIDFDPDVLYGRFEPASGVRIERRIVREPLASPPHRS